MRYRLAGFTIGAMLFGWAWRAGATPTTVTDGTFADSDWTVSVLQDSTTGGTALVQGWQQSNGGNPGAFRAVSDAWADDGSGSAIVVAGHLRTTPDYDPASDGAVGTVSFSLDARTTSTTYPTETSLRLFPIVAQGDTIYAAGLATDGPLGWSRMSWGPFEAASLSAYAGDLEGPAHPDFSTAGGALRFGFAVQSGPLSTPGTFATEGGVDNWSVEIASPSDSTDAGVGGGGGGNGQNAGPGVSPVGPMTLPRDDRGCACGVAGRARDLAGLPLLVGLVVLGRVRRRSQRLEGIR